MGSKLAATLHEARWCYERRAERMTYQSIADLSGAETKDGGLGRRIGMKTVRKRVREYVATLAVVDDETREEQRGRELADLDQQQRAFALLATPVDEVATLQRAFAMNTTLDALKQQRPDLIVLRDERVTLRALEGMRAVGESRRRLLGLDSPAEVRAEVTSRDAVLDELNAALSSAGLKPVKATS